MNDPALATPPTSSPPLPPHRPRFRFFRTHLLIGVVIGVALFAALGPVGLSVGLIKPGSIWNLFDRPASQSHDDCTAHDRTHRKIFVGMAAEFNIKTPDDFKDSEVIALLDRNIMAHSRILIALAVNPQYGEEMVTTLRKTVELHELVAEFAELTNQKAMCEQKIAQDKLATNAINSSARPFSPLVGL